MILKMVLDVLLFVEVYVLDLIFIICWKGCGGRVCDNC